MLSTELRGLEVWCKMETAVEHGSMSTALVLGQIGASWSFLHES